MDMKYVIIKWIKGGACMYFETDQKTCDEIKKVFEAQEDKPKNVRIFVAGIGCSGPSFGLGLDKAKPEDVYEEINGIKFLMDKEIYDEYGKINVKFMNGGYSVLPDDQPANTCGTCDACH
jgi:Fe-S cluster assembly iron-binding protein IscA